MLLELRGRATVIIIVHAWMDEERIFSLVILLSSKEASFALWRVVSNLVLRQGRAWGGDDAHLLSGRRRVLAGIRKEASRRLM